MDKIDTVLSGNKISVFIDIIYLYKLKYIIAYKTLKI